MLEALLVVAIIVFLACAVLALAVIVGLYLLLAVAVWRMIFEVLRP